MVQRDELNEQGYFVCPSILCAEECSGLLGEVLHSFGDTSPSVIRDPRFRRHSPLPLSPVVQEAITAVVEHGYATLASFLQNDQLLVELSSITVFPHADEQPLHRDEANEGSFLVSVFVNLTETTADAGALQVFPGSHNLEDGGPGSPIALELPAGSAVFMNSKLLHAGGANTTHDRFRPVFYFSFGERGLYGHTYSIREDVARKDLTLAEFRPRVGYRRTGWNAACRAQINPDCRLLTPLTGDCEEILLCAGAEIRSKRQIADEQEWLIDVLQVIERHPRELEVADLARHCEVEPDALLEQLKALGRAGWVRW